MGADLGTHRALHTGFSAPIPDVEDIYYQFSDVAPTYPKMAAILLERIDVYEITGQKYLRPMRFLMQGAAWGGDESLMR